jgi:uncharacterized membrane protein
MKPAEVLATAGAKVENAVQGVARFAKLERVLAIFCIAIPALLIYFDGGQIRPSISAYYSMAQSQYFYMPLTGAAMLFVVNGVVKQRRVYNMFLGTMLALLTFFNHLDYVELHALFAIGFFAGNAFVMLVYSSKKDRWFKGLMVAVIALAVLLWWRVSWFTLFWAEWVSMSIIAIHYLIESLSDDASTTS